MMKILKCGGRLEFKGNTLNCVRKPRHKGKHRSHYRYTVDGDRSEHADLVLWNDKGEWEFRKDGD